MFPQAELENYKLQVELLQEKLQRSEDNRQQLEHKLDKVLQKRSDLDKAARHKTRQKYQEFLEEQSQRNERNKKLVHMLERIDEQTAAMSQRSERLKMMKLQYQMYFAKLVQQQTLRCIQQTTTPMAMPMSVPMSLLVPPQTTATPAGVAGVAAPAPVEQQWAYTMATPTPAGMMLTTPRQTTAADFAPQPMYMPMPELFGGGGSGGNANLYDLRATLRALDQDNESAELPERISHGAQMAAATATAAGMRVGDASYDDMPMAWTGEYQASAATTMPSTRDKSLHELSSTSSTQATSLLTFDRLPKTPTLPLPGQTLTLTELPAAEPRPQMATMDQAAAVEWAPSSRVTKAEQEISPSVAVVNNEPWQQQQYQPQEQTEQQQQFAACFSELKIDEPWQPTATSMKTTTPTPQPSEDKLELNMRKAELKSGGVDAGLPVPAAGMGASRFSSELLDEVKASRAALEIAAAAVDEQLRGNQLSPPRSSAASAGSDAAATPKPSMSIENIENAIYGERLTTTTAAAAAAAAALPVEQGLFEEPATPLAVQEQASAGETEQLTHMELPDADVSQIDYGQYETGGYGQSEAEPSYASIEGGGAGTQQSAEPIYSEIGNPTDYQPYATDADADAAAAAEQQDYSNIDYSNYDATQYAGGYDPNAYPGYIYDEASGQYIADPNAAQYAADGSYAAQGYEEAVANYDYNTAAAYAEQQQQPAAEDYAAQEAAATESLPPDVDAKTEAAPIPVIAAAAAPATEASTSANKLAKPTSILATTDKQAAPNDAQQQQKKKKRVNFVDSSETDESSSAKPAQGGGGGVATGAAVAAAAAAPTAGAATAAAAGGGSESDFDFSTGSEAKN